MKEDKSRGRDVEQSPTSHRGEPLSSRGRQIAPAAAGALLQIFDPTKLPSTYEPHDGRAIDVGSLLFSGIHLIVVAVSGGICMTDLVSEARLFFVTMSLRLFPSMGGGDGAGQGVVQLGRNAP